MKSILLATALFVLSTNAKTEISPYDGIFVLGYVNNGAYLNFTGPNINFKKNDWRFFAGMLPSLRFKQEHTEPRNTLVTPTLGMGFTLCYKKLAIQLPFYYNAKTNTKNGQWHAGIGMGLRF